MGNAIFRLDSCDIVMNFMFRDMTVIHKDLNLTQKTIKLGLVFV